MSLNQEIGSSIITQKRDTRFIAVMLPIGAISVYGYVTFEFFEDIPLTVSATALSVLLIVVAAVNRRRMRSGLFASPAVLLPAGISLLAILSVFYAYVPSQAIRVAWQYAAAFAVFLTIYMLLADDSELTPVRIDRLLSCLVWFLAVISFLAIETASSRVLLSPLIEVLGTDNEYYAQKYGAWLGGRMMTLLNANVTAPLNMTGIFLAWYLYRAYRKTVFMCLSVALAMGFALCVSAGAVAASAIAAFVTVLASPRGERTKTLSHFFIALLCGGALAAAAFPFMGKGLSQGVQGAIPVALALLCVPAGLLSASLLRRIDGLGIRGKRIVASSIVALTAAGGVSAAFALSGSKLATMGERILFYKDALKLIASRPVFGHGAGAFETMSMQVQEQYYETKYVHSYYLQTLVETGLIGLLLAVALMAFIFFILIRALRGAGDWKAIGVGAAADEREARKSRQPPQERQLPHPDKALALALLGAFVLIALHAAIDFDMSFEWYQSVYLLLVAVASVRFAPGKRERGPGRLVRISSSVLIIVVPVVTVLSCIGFWTASGIQGQSDVQPVERMAQVKRGVVIDFPHAADYKAAWLVYLLDSGRSVSENEIALADSYAADLSKIADRSVGVCDTLVRYYFAVGEFDKALWFAEAMAKVRSKDNGARELAIGKLAALYEKADEAQRREVEEAEERVRLAGEE